MFFHGSASAGMVGAFFGAGGHASAEDAVTIAAFSVDDAHHSRGERNLCDEYPTIFRMSSDSQGRHAMEVVEGPVDIAETEDVRDNRPVIFFHWRCRWILPCPSWR